MDVFIQSCDVITRHTNKNVNKSSCLLFDNFLKVIDHFKTNHDNANGFYGAKAVGELFILKSTKPLPIIFKTKNIITQEMQLIEILHTVPK